jgi:hypothetical protein
MSMRGLRSAPKSLPLLVRLLLLSAIGLIIYTYLKNQTLNKAWASNMFNYFKSLGYSDLLCQCFVSQSAFETNGWTSDVFKQYNNAFGMRTPDGSDYQVYNTVNESYDALAAWYNHRRNNLTSLPLYITNISDYIDFIKNADYFESDKSDYLAGCQRYFNQLFT